MVHSERREKLAKVGYRTNFGVNDSGDLWQILTRGGGQYLGMFLLACCLNERLIDLLSCRPRRVRLDD